MSDLRTRIGYVVIGVVVAVCAGGWAVIMGYAGNTSPGIESQTIGFSVQSDTAVIVTFRIAKPEDALVTCVVRALSPQAREVGRTTVTAAAGRRQSTQVITLPTTERATAAEIRECARS